MHCDRPNARTVVGGLGGLTIAGLMPTILGLIGFGPAGPIAGTCVRVWMFTAKSQD